MVAQGALAEGGRGAAVRGGSETQATAATTGRRPSTERSFPEHLAPPPPVPAFHPHTPGARSPPTPGLPCWSPSRLHPPAMGSFTHPQFSVPSFSTPSPPPGPRQCTRPQPGSAQPPGRARPASLCRLAAGPWSSPLDGLWGPEHYVSGAWRALARRGLGGSGWGRGLRGPPHPPLIKGRTRGAGALSRLVPERVPGDPAVGVQGGRQTDQTPTRARRSEPAPCARSCTSRRASAATRLAPRWARRPGLGEGRVGTGAQPDAPRGSGRERRPERACVSPSADLPAALYCGAGRAPAATFGGSGGNPAA